MRQDEALRAAGGFLLSRKAHKHNMAMTMVGRNPAHAQQWRALNVT